MKLFKKLATPFVLAGAWLVATPAFAGTISTSDPFYQFYNTVTNWTQGALGTGLAITMLLFGGALGVAKNSPTPALSGVAGAAFLHWGPTIIQQMMSNGGVF
jgi:conjugal transfer pilus assembly protein TraA